MSAMVAKVSAALSHSPACLYWEVALCKFVWLFVRIMTKIISLLVLGGRPLQVDQHDQTYQHDHINKINTIFIINRTNLLVLRGRPLRVCLFVSIVDQQDNIAMTNKINQLVWSRSTLSTWLHCTRQQNTISFNLNSILFHQITATNIKKVFSDCRIFSILYCPTW